MPICAKCGQPLKDGASFCSNCGAAVARCPRCGQLLKDGASFCSQCGAAAAEVPGASASAQPPEPNATWAAASPVMVRLTLSRPFFAKAAPFLAVSFTETILIDGVEIRTIEMGETLDFPVLPGQHTIQLVHSKRSFATLGMTFSHTSDPVEFVAQPGSLPVVVGEFDMLLEKYDLALQGYFPLA
ncbi:MAG TPA: zinc ribbon domain-containing protein [Terracidiphilus sp.]|nr:zinc ribbon domain-containing protein [Terracidiphilus sp.]